jgi:hypothetical protein
MLVVMGEEVSIAGLRSEQAARRASFMARIQSIVIFLLLVWSAEEYNHNQYLQAWAGRSLGIFGFLLNGTLAAFYAGILIAVNLNRPQPLASHQKAERREPIVVSPETE